MLGLHICEKCFAVWAKNGKPPGAYPYSKALIHMRARRAVKTFCGLDVFGAAGRSCGIGATRRWQWKPRRSA
jgi:hypothetical protein